jgi:hypothetical protein
MLQLFISSISEKPLNKDKSFMAFSGSHFPKEPLIIEGDKVTFVFDSTKSSEMKMSTKRWGFRCVVSEVLQQSVEVQQTLPQFFLELENTTAILAAKYAAALVEGHSPSFVLLIDRHHTKDNFLNKLYWSLLSSTGDPPNEREKQLIPWLESRLLNGGLEELQLAPQQKILSTPLSADNNNTNISTSTTTTATALPQIVIQQQQAPTTEDMNKVFLDNFIEERGEAAKFYEWIKAQNKNRLLLPPQAKKVHFIS